MESKVIQTAQAIPEAVLAFDENWEELGLSGGIFLKRFTIESGTLRTVRHLLLLSPSHYLTSFQPLPQLRCLSFLFFHFRWSHTYIVSFNSFILFLFSLIVSLFLCVLLSFSFQLALEPRICFAVTPEILRSTGISNS